MLLTNEDRHKLKIQLARFKRIFLTSKDFSIISDNCWGGSIYQNYDMEYNTPFVGLFIFSSDYMVMLENLEEYMKQDLTFIALKQSKYVDFIAKQEGGGEYPIGKIGDIEIHFLHYSCNEEAYEKWSRRALRINYENLIVKYDNGNLSDDCLGERFLALPYERKVYLTNERYYQSTPSIKRQYENCLQTGDQWKDFRHSVNITAFLNKFYH